MMYIAWPAGTCYIQTERRTSHEKRPYERAGRARPDPADPFGSYTGRPEDPAETPVQDADDL